MNITIEELYKIKQNNQDPEEYFLSLEREDNLAYILERINTIEKYPEKINLDTENYFMNTFTSYSRLGECFTDARRRYETALNYVLYVQNKYDLKTLISEYEEAVFSENTNNDLKPDHEVLIRLYFEEFSKTGDTARIEDYYRNNKNFRYRCRCSYNSWSYLFYKALTGSKFSTDSCNEVQFLIDFWNEVQDLYVMQRHLPPMDIWEIREKLRPVEGKLFFKDEDTKVSYDTAYDEDEFDDFEVP